ncbi:hypothetical protein LSCM1_06293 [Leishmania martiniquensis]|uniref:Ankyrin repeat protein n=1 Tax=Leishmania martiniquensis TaxID=1580590 RepID=A0A836KM50_9TRYP|nr:hypothetical protein LSCM1_06293 [Leishmania martiniquensis]
MCPAFTTPQLQRVDSWSYGPLQPTIAIAASLNTVGDTSSERGAKQSCEQLVSHTEQERAVNGVREYDRCRNEHLRGRLHSGLSRLPPRRQPIRALLMRSDTAIDSGAKSWYTHTAVGQAAVAEEREHYESSSRRGRLINGRGSRPRWLVSPWQSCSVTGVLQSSLPFRYSLSLPLEDVRRVAQDAKQWRAVCNLYGSAATGMEDKSVPDHVGGGGYDDYQHRRPSGEGSAAVDATNPHAYPTSPPPSMPNIYYEVQMSVEYLLALYATDPRGAAPPDIGADALARSASNVLSEDAAHRLCKNCVVVGLCDSITAAQANGCPQGPSEPYVVTHLGHKLCAGDVVEDIEGGRSGGQSIGDERSTWSAGVSVSVIAHEEATEPSSASAATGDGAAQADVLYLGLWWHEQNSVRAIKAMPSALHSGDQGSANASESTAEAYLRLELPRCSPPAPVMEARAAAAHDVGRRRVAAAHGDAAYAIASSTAAAAARASANVWIPTITRACRDDVARAVATARQQQQQAETAQVTATEEAGAQAKRRPGGATDPPSPSPSSSLLSRVCSQVAATLVLGLLFSPSKGSLRLRLNNYADFEEMTLGLPLGNLDDATAARTTSASPALPPLLYPAATLSLNESGWRSWCCHQAHKWVKLQRQATQQGALTPGELAGKRAQADHSAPLSPTPSLSSSLSVSNAVVRFCFDVSGLLFGPPAPHQQGQTTPANATVSTREVAHKSQKKHQQRPAREPIDARASQSLAPSSLISQPIALLDSSVKFNQMLSVLTDVSLLAATKDSSGKIQQQQQLYHLGNSDGTAVEEEEDEFASASAIVSRGTATLAHPTVLLATSRGRRSRAAVLLVQRLLNTPGGGAAITTSADSSAAPSNSDCGDIFYPPVRIYRHSCHCPPRELYPLPTSSSDADAGDDAEVRSRRTQQQRRRRRGNRRIGLGRAGTGSSVSPGDVPSLLFVNVYWHDIIPENARLTPLCAAVASRQRAMAYAIATHPLTRFCDLSDEEVRAGDAHVWQQQQQQLQQRRTALYAACALGYTEVVQVLLERIPVEELLSYFGLVIESEARAALQRCYAKTNAAFLQRYPLGSQATEASSRPGADRVDSYSIKNNNGTTERGTAAFRNASAATAASASAVPYMTNGKQRALLDVSAIYSSSQSRYTPLHAALLGVVLENGEEDNEGLNEGDDVDVDVGTEEACMSSLNARLSKQTACVTVLLNCLYDLLCVAPASNAPAPKPQGGQAAVPAAEAQAQRMTLTGRELLVDALNLQSRAGETALLLAVRHNNVAVAVRLLKLGAQPACMDRVTRLLSLELACANRCTPIAEALLQPQNAGGVTDSTASTSVYAMSPVLLNHAGIATALCWCAINNMPSIMQRLLECDGIDVESGFEGSSPLHLAIAFGSEAAALTLLNGTQPRKTATASARKGRSVRAEEAEASLASGATAASNAKKEAAALRGMSGGVGRQGAAAPAASAAQPTGTASVGKSQKKPFMDVNIRHERTHCTPLHLACEQGQLNVIRTLLQSWHAQLNLTAAYTNYTPLLTAVANGREEAALRVLEYSKDQLRRGRAVLDLCAVDQNGDTALHLAASRGLALALEYMLVQFSEEEVTLLATLHPSLCASHAYQKATCIVPLHATNKKGKTALLAAVQHDQAETAELLVSVFIDSAEGQKTGDAPVHSGGESASQPPNSPTEAGAASPSASEAAIVSASSSLVSAPSLFGGPLIDGTCMALHQAHRRHLNSVVQLMLSAPPGLFPCTAAFLKSAQARKRQQVDTQHPAALSIGESSNRGAHAAFAVDERGDQLAEKKLNNDASQCSSAVAEDRGSFVRLLLTRAAGPTISPNDALRVLLRGFTLPELCVYLREVAAESAALGVQRGTAMAYAELLIGYLQEHAGSVVAPTRAVLFCREVLRCLQQWMLSEASAARERLAASRRHGTAPGEVDDLTYTQLLPDMEKSDKQGRKQHHPSDLAEAPMAWLYRMLLVPTAAGGGGACNEAERLRLSSPESAAEESERYRNALEATLRRKTLSLEVARMIRLHGRSNGGARAIEEIKNILQAYMKTKANARSQLARRTTGVAVEAAAESSTIMSVSSYPLSSALVQSVNPKSTRDGVEEVATSDRNGAVSCDAATAAKNKHTARRPTDVVGSEPLFTTPMGFTVLQLAATLGLPDVVAFLVKTYKLDPLYAPAQSMYIGGAPSAAPPPPARHSSAGGQAEEEAARVREVVAHTVRALVVETAALGADCGDYGSANRSTDPMAGGRAWFCWTPYRLAVHTGNTHTVESLLLAGSAVISAAGAVAKTALRDVCGGGTPNSVLRSVKCVEDSAGATGTTATLPASVLVDYKEPVWLDPYQRTALQERIVVATTCGTAPSSSHAPAASRAFTASAGASSSSAATVITPTLSETLAMVHLLLQHGAQPNGLFDRTGSDAWLLAVASSGAAGLPITHNSNAARCKGADVGMNTLHRADSQHTFAHLSSSETSSSTATSLVSIWAGSSEAAAQRCVELLLRYRAPLLEHASGSRDPSGTRLVGAQKSAESPSFNEQLLHHPHHLLNQWRRLPCMRLASTSIVAARSGRTRRVAGTAVDRDDGNGGDEGCEAAGDKSSGAAGHGNSVFEEADALCRRYEAQEPLLNASACGDDAKSLSPPAHASTFGWPGPFAAVEGAAAEPRGAARGRAVKLNSTLLASRHASEADSLAEKGPASSPLTPSASAASLKTQLIAALRLCYRVVLLYTCVEHAPLQLLQLVRAFGTAVIPLSARHPLSGDSVVTRLLRKTHARLLAGARGDGGGSSDSSSLPQGPLRRDGVPMSVLSEPPCTSDPAADPETRVLVDTCVALVHMLRDTLDRPRAASSAPPSQAASVAAAAAGNVLRSVLFQPSYDGETALSFAARIAQAPLIAVLVQSGAAASPASHNHKRGGHEVWPHSHRARSIPRRDDGTEARAQDGVGECNVSGLPVSSNYSLHTNLSDVVVRALLATRVYYSAHEIGTLRVLLAHMPSESARQAFLRRVYPNVHPLPALQLAMDNVGIASVFLTTPDCMNALWANLLYAHFTRQLDTAVRATAKAWNALLRVVLPGAPAVPIYLVMRAAVHEKGSTEALNVSRNSVSARSSQAGLPPPPQQSLASPVRSLSTAKKRSKAPPERSEMSNWSHIVRRTNLFLQLMSMSVAETLMSKSGQPLLSAAAATATLSPTATKVSGGGQHNTATPSSVHEMKRVGSFTSFTDGDQSPSHGLSGTLLWDTIELAVRYDDKDVLRHLLQLCLPEVVLTYINSIQQQQQALASTGTLGGAFAPFSVSTRAMEAASAAILGSYPSFASVSTTSQATLVLERLQRLLWREALQERHLDLLAVAAGSVATLRFLYMSSPPEVRSQMTPMRYDRIDLKSGMPEGVSPAPDTVAPAAASAEELMEALQEEAQSNPERGTALSECCSSGTSGITLPSMVSVIPSKVETDAMALYKPTKNPFSSGNASTVLSVDGRARSSDAAPSTPASPASPMPERASPSIVVGTLEVPDERSSAFPRSGAPQLQPFKTGKYKEEDEEESVATVTDAELRFMESCVQNGRCRLAAVEERRRRVTAVTWGLGATACAVKLPGAASDPGAVPPTTPGTPPQRTPTPPALPQQPAPNRATTARRAGRQLRIGRKGDVGDGYPANDSCVAIADANTTAARQAVRRRGPAKISLPITTSASVKEGGGKSPRTPTLPPAVEPERIYLMYLQLDWVLHSTRLLRSPRPSSATLETILFLLDQRAALSVPVLDLFLAGSAPPPRQQQQQHTGSADTRLEFALSLRYRTREHGDTLLHLLVIHDQCQLAEYYLEYCYLWFVSNALDPEPVSGRPGRFPIDEPAVLSAYNSSGDSHDGIAGSRFGCKDGYTSCEEQKRRTYAIQQRQPHSRRLSSSSSRLAEALPREFLRCMLRVNAHGLAAFDYAHTPAMLQLLEWYGCVPPTYRPNPRAFRRAVFHERSNGGGSGSLWEAFTLEGSRGGDDGEEVVDPSASTNGRTSKTAPRRGEVLHFFPVPRLILATDNFVALMDRTGTELASTVGIVATTLARAAPSGTTDGLSRHLRAASDESVAEDGMLVPARARQQKLNDRHVAAMISAEQRQLQVSRQRRQQQERVKALLFEQVAVQSQAIGISDSGEANKFVKSGALPYLRRAVTAQRRQQWEVQRHPPCNEMTLLRSALEAQRLSTSAFPKTPVRGRLKQRKDGGNGGCGVSAAGVLPILLSEEVSLLHLGLCSFEDELVRLYGELQTVSAPVASAGDDDISSNTSTCRTGDVEAGACRNGDEFSLSAYSRLLLPPSVTVKPEAQQQQGRGEGETRTECMLGGAPRDMDRSGSAPASKASRTTGMLLPRIPGQSGPMGGAWPPAQQSPRISSAPAANVAVATSEDSRPPEWASAPPRLSQLDVMFLLECQQFVVYPLSLPSSYSAAGVDDVTREDDIGSSSRAVGDDEHRVSLDSAGRTHRRDKKSAVPPLKSPAKEAASFGDLPAVIQRCTGGGIDTKRQRSKTASSGAVMQGASSSASTACHTAARSPVPPRRPSVPRERGGSAHDAPPGDLPLLRSLLARKAADDQLSEMIDVSAHRYEAALLVSLTPMLLSGLDGGGARVSAAATMRDLAGRLMDTRWKQFSSCPVLSGTKTGAAVTATEAVVVLNVPPFVPVDTSALQSHRAPFSVAAADERRSATSVEAPGSAAARVPTVMAARLEEWVARRWPPHEQSPARSERRHDGGRADSKPLQLPRTSAKTAHRKASEEKRTEDSNDDDEAAVLSVLDKTNPVGGVATAAQQALMRALLRRFTAATGAQLSEQMGLLITPNYDVEETGDTAAAMRGMEVRAAASPTAPKRR